MSKRPKIRIPTDKEDAAINAGIAADPDAQEISSLTGAKRGRPKLSNPKKSVTLRLDEEVVAVFKAQGKGWQTNINMILRESAGLKSHSVMLASGRWTSKKDATGHTKSNITNTKKNAASVLSDPGTKKKSSPKKRA